MRIALDLQACQTESRHRGIGRYSKELALALLQRGDESREYIIGLDQTYPSHAQEVLAALQGFVSEPLTLRYQYPGPRYAHGDHRGALQPAAEHLIRSAYAARSPDVVHVSSLFEGYVEHAAGLGMLTNIPGTLSSLTLYDLIPAIFPNFYLTQEPVRQWYSKKLEEVKRFDTLLCISEATKADAIRLLGLSEDRLFVINAGIDPQFLALLQKDHDAQALRAKFGIEKRFVMYTGNDDPRKNLDGAIRAFAQVPEPIRRGVQLVFNQVGDESRIRKMASSAGLSPNDLVITGRVSDQHLAGLLRECEVFFFPSLYEGFGLPVLEAMAAGTAAICGDNSSLPAVIGRKDALFDASSLDDSARALTRALSDEHFRKSLEADAVARSAEFTWGRAAAAACNAWDAALDRRNAGLRTAVAVSKRLKIAMVTPVPNERTGIADYVAELLPALAERMDVDVYTTAPLELVMPSLMETFSIRHWRELEACFSDYDQIVYQVGNSPFHSHMVDLLDKFGGLVVLHDFFVSSMFAHMDQHEGHPGLFARELERSHGRGALTGLASEEGWLYARKEFPACRRLIENGNGLILHSRHAADLSELFFPGLPRPPIFQIPHLRAMQELPSQTDRDAIRYELGVSTTEILIACFGFLADTKLNLEILAALSDPAISQRDDIRIVFVGELEGGAYGRKVTAAIKEHPLCRKISVTGFAENELYRKYLLAADAAIQLRTNSRGETSGTVLDCFASGVPVVVNDYAAFMELPTEVVAKVPAQFEISELAAQIWRLVSDPKHRRTLATNARGYIANNNDPALIAKQYEEAIKISMANARERKGVALAEGLIESVLKDDGDEICLSALEHSLVQQKLDETFKLFIDLSEVVNNDYRTGIHRVVRNLTRELVLTEGRGIRCIGVALNWVDRYASAEDYQARNLGLPKSSFEQTFSPRAGDVLFLLDSAWQSPERFLLEIERMKSCGGRVGAMVYDLIPLRFPKYCVDYMPAIFEKWLRFAVSNCDFMVCITQTVADDLAQWIRESGAAHSPNLKIGHIRLGCDVDEGRKDLEPASTDVRDAMGVDGSAVLMVGTLEPRKRHDIALDAFEKGWAQGENKRLVIVGKAGWNVESLARRISEHAQYGKLLFWLTNASDADLAYAYSRAERVLLASDAEGFGLPLIEASRYGRPLLLSDLPVFHEVAGSSADYFPAGDAHALAKCLLMPPSPAAEIPIPVVRWSDSASQTLRLIGSGPWDHVLG